MAILSTCLGNLKVQIGLVVLLIIFVISTIVLGVLYSQIDNEEIEKIDYRLPWDVEPVHYNLFLYPKLEDGVFEGNVVIDIKIKQPRKNIVLHSKNLNISTFKVLDSKNQSIALTSDHLSQDSVRDFLTISVQDPLSPGDYKVQLSFRGSLTAGITGFYRSSYLDERNEKRLIATSKFEPTFARLAFPCFDEPSMKAEFTVHLVRPTNGYIALSNMNEESSETNANGLTIVHFARSVKMSTYLACFIVCDFKHKEAVITNVDGSKFKFRSYATPAQQDKVQFAMDTGVAVTEYYIRYFDVNYPLPKLDMIAIPDFVSGAMEHWGLVTFRETALLYDEAISSTANKQRVATVVAHEVSHMWFGNLVTMAWWNELWLNEGFASYMQFKGVDQIYKDWGMLEQFVFTTVQNVMKLDATLAAHPIIVSVTNPNQITEIFDTITYDKGASIIRMLEHFVGEDRFKLGVTNYLKKHKYGNTKSSDLIEQLQIIVGKEIDIAKVMDTWTRQMGLPVVTVSRGSKPGEYELTQKRFLADPDKESEAEPSLFDYRWEIPLTYTTDATRKETLEWFPRSQQKMTITVNDGHKWIKFNNHQVGYYRVNYPADMWAKLAEQLNTHPQEFSPSDRAHLLNDVFSLAEARLVPYDTALSLTTYLSKEDHYVPWSVAGSSFASLKIFLKDRDIYPKFTKYARSVVGPAYKKMNWQVRPEDKHLEKHLRVKLLSLACSMEEPDCIEKVGALFKDWINDESKIPNPDLRALVYNHGMASVGSEKVWNIMWNRFKAEGDAQEKIKLMQGLSFVKDPAILQTYLKLAWDEENVRGQDYFTCIADLSHNPLATSMVWDFVRETWQKHIDRFGLGERSLGRLIPSITSSFSTEERLNEIKAFFAKYPEAGAGAAARKQALENTEYNIKWLKINQKSVSDWLEQHAR